MDINTLNGERSNECIKKMKKNQDKYSSVFSEYYFHMFQESGSNLYKRKSENISSCFKIQTWDKYNLNKIMDNTAHFRCRNRFCVNCQILINSYHVWKLKPKLKELQAEGFVPYFLTLTVPNCKFTELNSTVKYMNACYRKLFEKLNYDDKRAFKLRYMKVYGSVKVLEVSVNKEKKEFHPHFHILLLLMPDESDEKYLDANIQGRYSYNKNSYNYHSLFSIQIMKLWSMVYYKKSITKKSYSNWSDDPAYKELNDDGSIKYTNLEINLVPFRDKKNVDGKILDNNSAFLELLKYTVAFDDITTYEIFFHLEKQLSHLRRLQCNGILTGLLNDISEDDADTIGEIQDLILEIKEDPQDCKTEDLQELYTTYESFRKLYRKNTHYDREFLNHSSNEIS